MFLYLLYHILGCLKMSTDLINSLYINYSGRASHPRPSLFIQRGWARIAPTVKLRFKYYGFICCFYISPCFNLGAFIIKPAPARRPSEATKFQRLFTLAVIFCGFGV